ncbi:MAG: acetyl-CoA carboxylase biotin carboxylase subunit [Chloroflexota bacterium]
MTVIKRLLIANRGEIAVRIARTCHALGIETVAVYSDADRRSLHVLECDRAVHIGGSAPSESYLNIEAIIKAAQETGADALHPGYGLLSENPALAKACVDAGIIFVGPSADVIHMMGNKAEARKLAQKHGVPTIPGYEGENQSPKALEAKAQQIGWPVMIKAAAGGGGRGMRLVESKKAFAEAAEGARRESERAFGNGTLILEKAIVGGRHIEVQVLADAHGNVVHLGERDCSMQRRHQKVVEESPSPAVDAALRERMGESAVGLASAVGYVNAGTVEFMLDSGGNFYFLEMNTRLQVEHGVTELVTGLDLVALQLAVAEGKPLPFSQDGVRFDGHAIETRIYAEDPERGFLPSPGPIHKLLLPEGRGIRNDVGTYEGDEISTYYDPMISKLLAFAPSRSEAIERMARALALYRVDGVKTNLTFLRTIVTHPTFRAGEITTDWLDTKFTLEEQVAPEAAMLAALGYVVHDSNMGDPFLAAGPTGAGGVARLDLEDHGETHTLIAQRAPGDSKTWFVAINRRTARTIRLERVAGDHVIVGDGDESTSSHVQRDAHGFEVTLAGRTYTLGYTSGEAVRSAVDHRQQGLTAPMPGLVLKVLVKPGDAVRAHQTLVVLEAMKMEHSIEAPHDGVVKAVHCKEGGRVSNGELLVEIEQDKTEQAE